MFHVGEVADEDLDVTPGAERRARTGQDHGAGLRVVGDPSSHRSEFVVQRLADGVHLLRSIER